MRLSPRLAKIVDLLILPSRVIDVGTDHGYLPIYIAENTASSKIIASDYNKQPCEAALNHIQQAGVEDKVEVRQGSGLSVLNRGEVDQVVIAGMGSRTIIGILEADYDLAQSLERLVLQPMAGSSSLRKWLVDNNFKIIDEALVKEEDKLYQIIVAQPGKMEVKDDFELKIGPILLKKNDELLEDYFNELKDEWQKIINKIAENSPDNQKIEILKRRIKRLEEIELEMER
jgi:tRNA (adenine22-N1)-methyltransferase